MVSPVAKQGLAKQLYLFTAPPLASCSQQVCFRGLFFLITLQASCSDLKVPSLFLFLPTESLLDEACSDAPSKIAQYAPPVWLLCVFNPLCV